MGVLSVILAACGSTFGQFMVQPMRIDLATYPGQRTVTTFALENQNPDTPATIDLRLVDITQDSTGMWQTIDPNAEVVADPNGARWVNVGSEDQPIRVDTARLRSCLRWLRMEETVVELSPVQRKVIQVRIDVPAGAQGYFCAALTAQTQLAPDEDTGVRAPVFLQFIVPILINVQGRTMRDEINLVDANLMFRDAVDARPAATLVSLGIDNGGNTYARVIGRTRVYGEVGGHWQRITELDYPETSIIPGAKINLQQDIGRQLPSGKYRVAGALYINGRLADKIDKEILFEGNDRMKIAVDAALNLNPRELTIDVIPGATRTTVLKVSNASEDPVTVDAALLLPDHMTSGVWSDGQGNNILGQDFGCIEWVTIEPMQFTLRGYASQNLKIIAKMPNMPNPLPNYYAKIRLRATYEDAQTAGTAQGLIYLNTKAQGVQGDPRVAGTKLTLSPSTPSRYIVTASFSNIGNTHVMPRCRVLLSEAAAGVAGALLLDVPMTSEVYLQGGNMLPLESRQFTGVLDVASVPPGTYYVTAVLQYGLGAGAAAQRQAAIQIKDEGGDKSVEVISLDAVGGPTQIQL